MVWQNIDNGTVKINGISDKGHSLKKSYTKTTCLSPNMHYTTDDLYLKDNSQGLNVFFIERFHCSIVYL